jgi:hypothetical protein
VIELYRNSENRAYLLVEKIYQTAQRKAWMKFHLKRILLLVPMLAALSVCMTAADEPHDSDRRHEIWHNPHAGIKGQVFKLAFVVQPPPPGSPPGGVPALELLPYQATLFIWSAEGRFVTSFVTAEDGTFQAFLKPGRYLIVPYVSPEDAASLSAAPVSVTVGKKHFTQTAVVYVQET